MDIQINISNKENLTPDNFIINITIYFCKNKEHLPKTKQLSIQFVKKAPNSWELIVQKDI